MVDAFDFMASLTTVQCHKVNYSHERETPIVLRPPSNAFVEICCGNNVNADNGCKCGRGNRVAQHKNYGIVTTGSGFSSAAWEWKLKRKFQHECSWRSKPPVIWQAQLHTRGYERNGANNGVKSLNTSLTQNTITMVAYLWCTTKATPWGLALWWMV